LHTSIVEPSHITLNVCTIAILGFNKLNAVQFIAVARIRYQAEGSTDIHCYDAALKFIWMLGIHCLQGCEVRVNVWSTS